MAQKNNKKKEIKAIDTKVPLYDPKGNEDGLIELDAKLFTGIVNKQLLYQAVNMYHANDRVGMASTKQRDEVEGGGKKPWRQKGTGRARAGSIRSPLWKGGGKVFGPHPRSFKYQLPKKIKRLALIHSLNAKLADKVFGVIKSIGLEDGKTKSFKSIIDKTKMAGSIIIAVDKRDDKLVLASRNLAAVTLVLFSDLNAFDILKHKNFLVTEKGLSLLTEKLRG
jgi:large subunit ribosomal protein L4